MSPHTGFSSSSSASARPGTSALPPSRHRRQVRSGERQVRPDTRPQAPQFHGNCRGETHPAPRPRGRGPAPPAPAPQRSSRSPQLPPRTSGHRPLRPRPGPGRSPGTQRAQDGCTLHSAADVKWSHNQAAPTVITRADTDRCRRRPARMSRYGVARPGTVSGRTQAGARSSQPRTSSHAGPAQILSVAPSVPAASVRGRPWKRRRCTPTVLTARTDRPSSTDARPLYVRGHRNTGVYSATS
jgi:hypothetical protein